MRFISSWDIKNIVSVPFVLSKPCANHPSCLVIALVQTSCVTGSFASFLYLVMVYFVMGWTNLLAQCSSSIHVSKLGAELLRRPGIKAGPFYFPNEFPSNVTLRVG